MLSSLEEGFGVGRAPFFTMPSFLPPVQLWDYNPTLVLPVSVSNSVPVTVSSLPAVAVSSLPSVTVASVPQVVTIPNLLVDTDEIYRAFTYSLVSGTTFMSLVTADTLCTGLRKFTFRITGTSYSGSSVSYAYIRVMVAVHTTGTPFSYQALVGSASVSESRSFSKPGGCVFMYFFGMSLPTAALATNSVTKEVVRVLNLPSVGYSISCSGWYTSGSVTSWVQLEVTSEKLT